MAPDAGIAARRAALGMLAAALRGDTAWTALAQPLPPRDAAFARRLAFGVLRWYGTLDWLAGQLVERPRKPRDDDIRLLLLSGLQQLWHEDLPGHAAVHATAGCARALGKPWAVGLVNAVLRRFQREQAYWTDPARLGDHAFAHPPWLLEALRHDWPRHWPEVVAAGNRQPPLWIRCNRQRVTRAALARQLEAAGLATAPHPLAADALQVLEPQPVEALPGFADGLFSVQDAAAQLAADLLDPQAGERVLDACAAPGGKTAHLLERCPGAEVTALDSSAPRLARVHENLARLGLSARVLTGDAGEPGSWWDGEPFGRILLDAPCSATGVIRRHPEIKWLRSQAQVDAAVASQARLLDALWPLLGAGGMLVYATCSVLRRENREQIQAFLERHGDAVPAGPGWADALDETPGQQWLPGMQDMDGFYYAVLRKQA